MKVDKQNPFSLCRLWTLLIALLLVITLVSEVHAKKSSQDVEYKDSNEKQKNDIKYHTK